MKKTLFILQLLFLFSCSKKDDDLFLSNFIVKEKFNESKDYSKQINSKDVKILEKSLIKNDFVFNTCTKYYYGYKSKIDDNLYLISYCVDYIPRYKPTFRLVNWYDKYICIYKLHSGITSRLKIESSDPISSFYSVQNNVYTIKSLIKTYDYNEEKDKSCFSENKIIKKYKIEGEDFVEI